MATKKKIIGGGVDVQTTAGVSALTVNETTGAATVGPSGFTGPHTFNGVVAATSYNVNGRFEVGKTYAFGDYTGIQNLVNPAAFLILVAGSDVNGDSVSALYLINPKVPFGSETTTAIRVAGTASVSITVTYIATDIFRITNTSSADGVGGWRYIGGF